MSAIGFLLASAVGAGLRALAAHRLDRRLPVGTLIANLAASFLLGLLAEAGEVSRLVVGAGLLGSLSTWSSLANHVAALLRGGDRLAAALYLCSSLVLGVAAAGAGLALSA